MKIGFISTMAASPWAGSEELWIAAAKAALARGHDVTASVFKWPKSDIPSKLAALQEDGARLLWRQRYGFPSLDEAAIKAANFVTGRVFARSVQLPAAIGALGAGGHFAKVAADSPDIICLSQGWPYDMLDAPGSRTLIRELLRTRIPYVVVCHLNIDSVQPKETVRSEVAALYQGACRVLFVSEHNLRATERQLACRVPGARIVANPVNLADSAPVPWTERAVAQFACVGRLDVAHKGQDILLEALSEPAWKRRPDWALNIYGAGEDEAYLLKLVTHFGLSDRVRLHGHVADVRAIWEANDILLLSSRSEGTPLSLVEAMLCGRPAVVTDVGGNAEWVQDGLTGYVAPAPTASSFAASLQRAWDDRPQWIHRGRAACEIASRRIDLDPGGSLLQILTEAAASRAGSGVPAAD